MRSARTIGLLVTAYVVGAGFGCRTVAGRPVARFAPVVHSVAARSAPDTSLANDAPAEAVGSLIRPAVSGESPQLLCSGSLIAPRVVLTAKHCARTVSSVLKAGAVVAFALGPSIRAPVLTVNVSGAEGAPGDEGGWNGIGHDIGIVHLAQAVSAVTPLEYAVLRPEQVGSTFVGVGYGVRGAGAERQVGDRRVGELRIRSMTGRAYEALFGDYESYLVWYTNSTTPPTCAATGSVAEHGAGAIVDCSVLAFARKAYDEINLEAASEAVASASPDGLQPCFGDSGGPLLQRSATGKWAVHAVLSGGVDTRGAFCDHGAIYAVIDAATIAFVHANTAASASNGTAESSAKADASAQHHDRDMDRALSTSHSHGKGQRLGRLPARSVSASNSN